MSNKSYKKGHPCLIPDLEGRAFSISLLNILAVVVQLLSCVQFFANPWTAARQASLSLTVSQSLLKLMSTESVKPSNRLILCRPPLLLPSVFPSIRVFSDELALSHRVAQVLGLQPQHQSFQ